MVAAASLALGALSGQASADVLVDDTFDPGSTSPWQDISGVSTSIGAGTGPLAGESVLIGATGVAVNQVARAFDAVTLANINTSISVSFDYQLTSGISGDYLPAFGLYNSGGTAATADKTDDVGYYVKFNPKDDEATLFYETGDSYGPVAGSGVNTLIQNGNYPAFSAGDMRHFELLLTRSAADTIDLKATVTDPDGTTATFTIDATASGTSFVDTFDTIYLRSRYGNYELDNVQVESIIPEPGSLGLMGLGVLLVFNRHRTA